MKKLVLTGDYMHNKIVPLESAKEDKVPVIKKWLVGLDEKQHEWLKNTISQTGVNGSAIIRALIDREMKKPSTDIKSNLVSSKLEAELRNLQEKRAAIEERINEKRQQLKSKKPVDGTEKEKAATR